MEILDLRCQLRCIFVQSHLDYFPYNCGDFSEEQGDRIHQDISIMVYIYRGRGGVNIVSDYCWYLKRDIILIQPLITCKQSNIDQCNS